MQLCSCGLLDGSLGGRCGVRSASRGGAYFEMGPAACQTARSCIASADGLRRARCLAQWLARGALAEDSIRDWPGVLPDGSLVALRWMVRSGPGVLPDGSLVALRRMVRSRRARILTRWLTRICPVRRIIRRIRCMPNSSRDNCLTGKIRKGIRSHTRPSWVWAGARSYSSWSV